jgi:hypothetical protein
LHAGSKRRAAASKSVRNTMSYIVKREVAQVGGGSQVIATKICWDYGRLLVRGDVAPKNRLFRIFGAVMVPAQKGI